LVPDLLRCWEWPIGYVRPDASSEVSDPATTTFERDVRLVVKLVFGLGARIWRATWLAWPMKLSRSVFARSRSFR
jgi:hypothetical protein